MHENKYVEKYNKSYNFNALREKRKSRVLIKFFNKFGVIFLLKFKLFLGTKNTKKFFSVFLLKRKKMVNFYKKIVIFSKN